MTAKTGSPVLLCPLKTVVITYETRFPQMLYKSMKYRSRYQKNDLSLITQNISRLQFSY
jgi:hypothetical protein